MGFFMSDKCVTLWKSCERFDGFIVNDTGSIYGNAYE